MLLRSNSKIFYFVLLLSICALLSVETLSQARFVQITDLHIYDDKPENRQKNKQAFQAAINEINIQNGKGAPYDFVVVTGDLGIEQLVGDPSAEPPREFSQAEIENNIKNAALEFSTYISQSQIEHWLFVAGNNDLFDERPENTKYFDSFIEKLQAGLSGSKKIYNLTSETTREYPVKNLLFLGFNAASFKNQNRPRRLECPKTGEESADDKLTDEERARDEPTRTAQSKEVDAVLQKVNAAVKDGSTAQKIFIFYHIPEIDDRYLVEGTDKKAFDTLKIKEENKQCIGEDNIYSAWFIRKEIRNEWNKAVKDERVRGLFAGHFHDYRRDTYQKFYWPRSLASMSSSLSKLYVCPPLALKLQEKTPGTARGFQEVSIDAKGNVPKNGVSIFWYDEATNTFTRQSDDAKESEITGQLRLARIYENNGRPKEAEDIYTTILTNNDPGGRERAGDGLDRVLKNEASWRLVYFISSLIVSALLLLVLPVTASFYINENLRKNAKQSRRRPVPAITVWIISWFLFIGVASILSGDYFFNNSSLLPNWAVLTTVEMIIGGCLLCLSIWKKNDSGNAEASIQTGTKNETATGAQEKALEKAARAVIEANVDKKKPAGKPTKPKTPRTTTGNKPVVKEPPGKMKFDL